MAGGPLPASPDDASAVAPVAQGRFASGDEGYLALVWRRFRRSVVGLAAITDISPRVLADAVFRHDTGLALLLAPGEGDRMPDLGAQIPSAERALVTRWIAAGAPVDAPF